MCSFGPPGMRSFPPNRVKSGSSGFYLWSSGEGHGADTGEVKVRGSALRLKPRFGQLVYPFPTPWLIVGSGPELLGSLNCLFLCT